MKKNKRFIIFTGIIALLFIGYLIADTILFNGIKPVAIHENGFQANYFARNKTNNKTAVILIGGGAWGNYWAQKFANNAMVGLSLPYTGKEGLPKLPEAIKLEYFENAINWLKKRPEVNPDKIIVMGASRNAELALVIATTFPELISGVIAYAPSAVSWSNTVLPYNSNELKPSWTYKNSAIPYIPMEKLAGNATNEIDMMDYWTKGLSKKEFVTQAIIKVEKINGPILLLSGIDDNVWPSAMMSDMLEDRIKNNNFDFDFKNIKYANAGHLIAGNPNNISTTREGKIEIEKKIYNFNYGGTATGDLEAQQNAQKQVFTFLSNIENE